MTRTLTFSGIVPFSRWRALDRAVGLVNRGSFRFARTRTAMLTHVSCSGGPHGMDVTAMVTFSGRRYDRRIWPASEKPFVKLLRGLRLTP